jgi:hypothetical protein
MAKNPLVQERAADPIEHRGTNPGSAPSEQENHAPTEHLYLPKNKRKYACLRTGMHMKNVLQKGGSSLPAASMNAHFSA